MDDDQDERPDPKSSKRQHDRTLKSSVAAPAAPAAAPVPRRNAQGATSEAATPMMSAAYARWSVEELRDLAEARDVQIGKKASRTTILAALAKAAVDEPDAMRRVHEVRAIPLPEAEDDLVRELRQTVDSEFATTVRRGMLLADLRERCGDDDKTFGKKLKGYNLGISPRQARRYRFLVEPAAQDLIRATIFETGKPPSLTACEEAVAGRPTRTRTSEKKEPKADDWSAAMTMAQARERLMDQVIDLLDDGDIDRKIKTAGSVVVKDTDTGEILGTIGIEPMKRPDLTTTTRQTRQSTAEHFQPERDQPHRTRR